MIRSFAFGPPVVRSFGVNAFSKRQNETRNRSLTFKNAFPPRETDQNFLKTPSRGGKWGEFSEKRLPAAGNGKKSQKNGFLRREGDKIARKTPSCGGKRGRTAYAPRTFPTETIYNRIGTGCLKCPPLLSPLRCIWGRKHYAPTASGAFVLNGIEQCHRKRFVAFLWHLSSRRMQKQKRPFARADGCI